MSLLLVRASKKLSLNKEIMDSYWKYYKREQNCFFLSHPNLDQASRQPSSFNITPYIFKKMNFDYLLKTDILLLVSSLMISILPCKSIFHILLSYNNDIKR
ncbi:hypothetical protein A8C32_05225 [Flavivirga aquatica]|uniref:Uncharacterized protein n=1 Tax=Flavivirga aquatica TaxID=1849968 RepID=A0A1E5SHL0_9FLAO|nr:hypothetical protein [Flavivirga aquatica]OEJ98602.1 hypothetical protein A8C32_05225 [Flavivirga aquatica]